MYIFCYQWNEPIFFRTVSKLLKGITIYRSMPQAISVQEKNRCRLWSSLGWRVPWWKFHGKRGFWPLLCQRIIHELGFFQRFSHSISHHDFIITFSASDAVCTPTTASQRSCWKDKSPCFHFVLHLLHCTHIMILRREKKINFFKCTLASFFCYKTVALTLEFVSSWKISSLICNEKN